MIYSTCVFVYCLYECFKQDNSVSLVPVALLFIFSVTVTVVYLMWKEPVFHQVMYGALVACLVLRSVFIVTWVYPWLRPLCYTSLGVFLFGFLLWNIDNIFCDSLRTSRQTLPSGVGVLTQFHAWWHIFTGLGSYLHILLSLQIRSTYLKYRPKVKQVPYWWPVQNFVPPASVSFAAAPPQMIGGTTMMMPGTPSMAPSVFMREAEDEVEQQYIKKPPNAFMVFARKHRKALMGKLDKKDSASVNVILGEMWNSLPQQDQAKYYEEADVERRRHAQLYPNWSMCDNYGKKRKRMRGNAATSVSDLEAPQPTRMCVAPVQTGLMGPDRFPPQSDSQSVSNLACLQQPKTSLSAFVHNFAPPAAPTSSGIEFSQLLSGANYLPPPHDKLQRPPAASSSEPQGLEEELHVILERFEEESSTAHTEESVAALNLEEELQSLLERFQNKPTTPQFGTDRLHCVFEGLGITAADTGQC
nr:alkaline ceramidase 3 isoform X2 [Doryrhamphus excisus]